ncbi:nitrile hydratase subunit beta [Pseudomonas laurylsulfatiphila]|jgi:nitrile hydratase|uniref:Nitrile hydratase subunit beta n=1 Tax=Pseudomonas laurylsulfatiphila TaxID=2011015 RepID=A0A2S6FNN1_9PSED|nr:nitrile hydratase subunit beta [Pseudomonas laurylsulfatiphila]PPK39048.1 nitrile hydratase subunit beta [Pseudomonas laurylsulfatiphila]
MDGIHDLGGLQGFGRVQHTANSLSYKPVFHEDWEKLGYSLLFLGAAELGLFNVDELRHAIERMEPRQYLTSSYYDRIIVGVASLFVEKGALQQQRLEELAAGAYPLAMPWVAGRAPSPPEQPFQVGDQVLVRNEFVSGHIRMPGYVRGKRGVVVHRTSQEWPFPDTVGHGHSSPSEPTYHVQFTTQELWGDQADAGKVVVDLFGGYLLPA